MSSEAVLACMNSLFDAKQLMFRKLEINPGMIIVIHWSVHSSWITETGLYLLVC